jgi:hypothetical protein
MVIIADNSGRLANKLFLYSGFIANAIHFRYRLVIPTFQSYRRYFPLRFTKAEDNALIKYTPRIVFLCARVCYLFLFWLDAAGIVRTRWLERADKEIIDLADSRFTRRAKKNFLFVSGWLFRDNQHCALYAERLRSYFTPKSKYMTRINRLIGISRVDYDFLIGVHLRKGDYKTWNQGKYYFLDSVYADKMLQLKDFFRRQNKSVRFLMCSNEKVDANNFSNLDIFNALGHPVEDLYSLAFCDYIIGPPSTYSMWASFYGKVPLLHIIQPDQIIRLSDFRVHQG